MTDMMLDLEPRDGMCPFCEINPVGPDAMDMCDDCLDSLGCGLDAEDL